MQFKDQNEETQEQSTNTETSDSHNQGALDACQAELARVKEQLIRVSADFENFRKRMEKERGQWVYIAQADVFKKLLPIIDDFDRAMAQRSEQETADQRAWISGFELIAKSLHKFLESMGVTEITENSVFDPQFHEAVSHIDSPEHTSGQIISVLQRGYSFKDTVLRPARVVVAR